MKIITNNINQKEALFAGIFYFILAVTGLFSLMYALPQIKIDGNITQTILNINENSFLFRIGIVSTLIMNIVSILLVIYLYKLLSKINKTMALSMLVIMLFGAIISAINELNHFAMIIINNSESYTTIEKQNLTQLFAEIQKHGSYIAVIFWGLWLFPLGRLIYKLGTRLSQFIGIMLLIAGTGYLLDSFFLFVYPNMNIPSVSDYTSWGEIILMFWLLFKSKHIGQLVK